MSKVVLFSTVTALMLVGLFLAGCGSSNEPAPTATEVSKARPTLELPTSTPDAGIAQSATATPPSTATSPPPTPESQPPTPTSTPEPPPTPIPAAPEVASPDFGVQVFLWWRPEVADRDLGLVKDHGFRWVRQTFAWEDIEGAGKGQFDWSTPDRIVQQVNDHGLYLLTRLSSDPEQSLWAGSPPGNGQNFADFARSVAGRYCGRIQAYQIWNEPNLMREWGGRSPNPAEYAAFLGQAYSAIKQACPSAIVISAGMAPTGYTDVAYDDIAFYEGMYQAMGGSSGGYFDMLGAHGAGFAAPPELDPAQAAANQVPYGGYRFFSFRHVEDIRAVMERFGDGGKRIAILEFGWTYDPVNPAYKWHGADAGIDDFVQGCYIVRAYKWAREHWQPWIGIMSALTMPNLSWIEDGKDPRQEEQYWWAIMEPSRLDELNWRPAIVMVKDYVNEGFINDRCSQ